MKKVLILGRGKMGSFIGNHLSTKHNVVYADKDNANYNIDMEDFSSVYNILAYEGPDVIVGAAGYKFNYGFSKLAAEWNTPFIDLGGNNDIVEKQFTIKSKATIIPDCGLAPGLAPWLAHYFAKSIKANTIIISVGGIPQALNEYSCEFSVNGLVNEYIEDCKIKRNGQIELMPGLSDLDNIIINNKEYESFNTSGGISTVLKNCSAPNIYYKTIRYRGHCNFVKELRKHGFFNSTHRENTENVLSDYYASNRFKDIVIVQVLIDGQEWLLLDEHDGQSTAMARCTGYPAAIVADMLLDGRIRRDLGVISGENAIPMAELITELGKVGLIIKKVN